MNKAIVIYGSTSGNTAFLAQFVKAGLETGGFEVVVKNVKNASIEEFKDYDLVVLGSSTWDGKRQDGLSGKEQNKNVQGNLQIDMKSLAVQLSTYDFVQRPVALFGVGHYSYTFTCNAALLLEELVKKANGRLIGDVFKVIDVADLYTDAIEQWASELKI
ncbi:MAG: flavodoxin domain-containing protein [bacterium]|nr:flavodoxin domain-containing protein [bacterium]